MNIQMEAGWKQALSAEFEKTYFRQLVAFLKEEKARGKVIYPAGKDIFRAFELTPVDEVRVLLLGQDPYHGPGQAHGLCFSVQPGIKPPPSLQNIFKELQSDLGCNIPHQGDLSAWARQGVLLLNASLTVEAAQPMSHSRCGWASFTDAVIRKVSEGPQPVVFLLWGGFARQKRVLIDSSRHLILESAHPSPLSAHQGFLGCRHFSRANAYLRAQGLKEINWCLP